MFHAHRFASLTTAVLLSCTAVFLWTCERQEPATQPSGETPPFLRNTTWPAAFRVPFSVHTSSSSPASGPNRLDYSFPAVEKGGRTDGKLHSFYQSCLPFPCVPTSFVKSPCHFYLFRDASRGGRYTAYVYSERHEYAVLVDGLGPMLPDFLQRYYEVNPVAPQPKPSPDWGLPVGNPSNGKVLWFRAAGFGGYPETEDLFAVYDAPTRTPQGEYRPPYSFGGKHGQLVYGDWNLKPDFGPRTFQPPAGYQRVESQPVTYTFKGVTLTLECPIRFPFDLYDHPLTTDNGKLEPLRESVMVCAGCHSSDVLEDRAGSAKP